MSQNYKVFGEISSGPCPSEQLEMSSFFNRLRLQHPSLFRIALHIRNEGQRSQGQVMRMKSDGGFVKGASDVIIPGKVTFVMEMKSRAKTARLSDEQKEYLITASNMGAFACVALGCDAAWQALQVWLLRIDNDL